MNQANKDLINYIESIPYGTVYLQVLRENRKIKAITTTAEETLRYVNNDEARNDLDNMLKSLIESGYTGEANVKLSMNDGQIKLLSVFNKKETKY